MNIDELTLGQVKQLHALFDGSKTNQREGLQFFIGKKCIVRTYSDGVWFGEIVEKQRMEVLIKNARRLYQWKNKKGISINSVAINGVDEDGCRFSPTIPLHGVEAIGITPCTDESIKSIEGVKDATP